MTGMLLLLCAVLVQTPATRPAAADEQPTSRQDSTKFDKALQQIDQRSRQVHDVTAHFRQMKHTALLKTPMQSEGTLRIRKDGSKSVMRWDTTKPHPSTLIATESELRIYYPSQSLLEIYPIESSLPQLAGSPLPQLAAVRKRFSIEAYEWKELDAARAEQSVALRLRPIEEDVREHLVEVRILIDTDTSCVTHAEILYPDDERLVLEFTEIRLNTGLQERDLELKVGPEVEIARPLGGRSRDSS